jgi:hypothetical protein
VFVEPNFTATITIRRVNSFRQPPRVCTRKKNLNALPGTADNTTDGWKYMASNGASPFNFTIDFHWCLVVLP